MPIWPKVRRIVLIFLVLINVLYVGWCFTAGVFRKQQVYQEGICQQVSKLRILLWNYREANDSAKDALSRVILLDSKDGVVNFVTPQGVVCTIEIISLSGRLRRPQSFESSDCAIRVVCGNPTIAEFLLSKDGMPIVDRWNEPCWLLCIMQKRRGGPTIDDLKLVK